MKKKILMIFTGGTIAMKVEEDQGAVPGLESGELVSMVKDLDRIADIETIDFGNLPSPHMTLEHMLDLSKLVQENLDRDDISAVVISHGTDTLEESAYFLDLNVKSEKPLVLVGSMRNNSELGYDGAANISAAVYTALSEKSKSKGSLVVMNNEIHAARDVSKINTSSLDTFKSLDYGPLGYIVNKEVIYHRDILYRQYIGSDKLEKVGLIKLAAGIESELVDFYIDKGYKGIVIEALGAGNIPPSLLAGVERAIREDVVIVLVSRCLQGPVSPVYGYEGGGKTLMDLGLISGQAQNGQKARIKLALALGKSMPKDEIKDLFESVLM